MYILSIYFLSSYVKVSAMNHLHYMDRHAYRETDKCSARLLVMKFRDVFRLIL
jgi:hypothetical protein